MMGKYNNSRVHDWWSDWHYKNLKIKRNAWLTDADDMWFASKQRVWHEMRSKGIVAIVDLKWKNMTDAEMDKLTTSEIVMMNFYEKQNIPYYIIAINEYLKQFHIFRPKIASNASYALEIAKLAENEMIDWINADYEWETLQTITGNKLMGNPT